MRSQQADEVARAALFLRAVNAAMSDICAAELDALSPFELELVARALQLRQPLTASAVSARLASLSAQQRVGRQ